MKTTSLRTPDQHRARAAELRAQGGFEWLAVEMDRIAMMIKRRLILRSGLFDGPPWYGRSPWEVRPEKEMRKKKMPAIENTPAGLQTVLPGCERRTLAKSKSAADDAGQGLLEFYRPPTLRERLNRLAEALMQPRRRQPRA
jgi:hypothetical protein